MDTQVSTDMRSLINSIICCFITFERQILCLSIPFISYFANKDIPTKHMISYYNMLIYNKKKKLLHFTRPVTSNGCMCYDITQINTLKGATVHIILPTQYFYTWVLIG